MLVVYDFHIGFLYGFNERLCNVIVLSTPKSLSSVNQPLIETKLFFLFSWGCFTFSIFFLFFYKNVLIFCSLSHHRILIKLCSIIPCTRKKPKSESSIQLLLFSSRKELHLICRWKLYFIFMLRHNINLLPRKELSFILC